MKKIISFALMLCAAVGLPLHMAAQSAEPAPAAIFETATVAAGKIDQIYRIPALAALPDGTLVALFDDRGDNWSDLPGESGGNSNVKVVATVSHDKGHTWSEPKAIGGVPYAYGDPAVAYDRTHGRLVALLNAEYSFASKKPARLYVATSKDGENWTVDPEDKSPQLISSICDYKNGFVTAGNMLPTDRGIYCVVPYKTVATNTYPDHIAVLRSSYKDGRYDWHCVGRIGGTTVDEAHLALLPDGRLLLSTTDKRDIGDSDKNDRRRLLAFSSDGGTTWTELAPASGIRDCGVNGDIISFRHDGRDYLLTVLATEDPADGPRQDLFAFWSTDGGKSWNRRLLYKGTAAYTALVSLPDGTVGCLAELNGSIDFFRFDMDWLLKGR